MRGAEAGLAAAAANVVPGCALQRLSTLAEFSMNRDQAKGTAKDAAGKIQRKAGELTGNRSQQVKGAVRQVAGKVQKGVGDIRQAADRNADKNR